CLSTVDFETTKIDIYKEPEIERSSIINSKNFNMPSIFNLKGNLGNDPLDNLKAFPSLILTSILNLILIIIIIAAVHGNVSCVLSPGIISIFIVTLILTSLSNQLRKSSSVIVSLLFFIPFLWIGLYTDSNNQVENIFSWKIFLEPSMLSFINTGIYKIVLTSLVYSLLLGVFNLFLARLLALLFV